MTYHKKEMQVYKPTATPSVLPEAGHVGIFADTDELIRTISDAGTLGAILSAAKIGIFQISQAGTADPTFVELVNTTGSIFTAARGGVGQYTFQGTGGVFGAATFVAIGGGKAVAFGEVVTLSKPLFGSTTLSIYTGTDPATPADDILNEHVILILQY